jgi:hypothetical protein
MDEGNPSCPSCGAIIDDARSAELSVLGGLAEEFVRRIQAGQAPAIEEYEARRPELAGKIHELFGTLLLLEKAAAAPASETPTGRSAQPEVAPPPRRFATGDVLSGRYRIVSLLGKGGMGEVYRAEDLVLGQPVALKLLPGNVDGAALARLYREVSVARQVSHPNVCRVFDIGENEGSHFLSMEYIDGEDLASLLRRIGRLPHDKGIDIARQLCAGLAAAHDSLVLHRDIKPANIMIDGRGRARITDFGLATAFDQLHGVKTAGTLAYMAPEQLANQGLSLKTDIYGLGLVLYEIFTGKRVFDAVSATRGTREFRHIVPPSMLVKDMDPLVERVILRCLRKDPEDRPSAAQIASALPGGDPVAIALAAGEVPSPEMLAASPLEGDLPRPIAVRCLAAFLLCLFFMMLLSGRGMLHTAVPLDHSPEVLADRAAEKAARFGYDRQPADAVYGFARDEDCLNYIAAQDGSSMQWSRLAGGRFPALYFWYRSSPQPLVPRSLRRVAPNDPPMDTPGMISMLLDTTGRILEFEAVPVSPSVEKPKPVDWGPMFAEAGLEMEKFQRVEALDSASGAVTERAAWEGASPDWPGVKMRVEAASWLGRPVHFRIHWPWSRASTAYIPAEGRTGYQQGSQNRGFFAFSFAIYITSIIASIVFARRNVRLGQGDRRAAFRISVYVFVSQLLASVLQAHHVQSLAEIDLFYAANAWALFYAVELWLMYLAIEPYFRQKWPYTLISWSRLVGGKFRDPMVGRDLLLGALAGTATTLLAAFCYMALPLMGVSQGKPPLVGLGALRGIKEVAGQILAMQREAITDPMFLMVILVLATSAFRNRKLAFGLTWALFTAGAGMLIGVENAINWAVVGFIIAAYLTILIRVGLLAAIAFQLMNFLLLNFQMTADLLAWYAGGTVVVMAIGVAIAIYGYRTSVGFHRSAAAR